MLSNDSTVTADGRDRFVRRVTLAILLALLVVAAPVASQTALAGAADDETDGGPPDRWSATVGGSGDDKLATGVRVDDGYLVVGWSNSSTDDGEHDGYVAKLDRTGETEWERTYGGEGTDRFYDVTQVEDGYLVAGMSTDGASDTWSGWMMKLGPDGETRWDRTYDDSSPGAFWGIAKDDGRIYVAGWQDRRATTDAWAMELEVDGDPVWTETYDTQYSSSDEYLNSVFATGDGELIMTGSVTSGGTDPSDGWVLKVGDDGGLKWDETYGGGNYDRVHDAVATDDGSYVLAGQTASAGAGEKDGWMLKVRDDGEKQWDRTYGTPKTDALFGIHDDPDGGYAVSGTKHVLGEQGADGWVVRTDDEGYEQWENTYGESYWDKFWPVIEGHGGGYLAIGESTSFSDDRDGWVVRIGGPAVSAIRDADDNESGTTVAFDGSPVQSVTLSDANASGVLTVSERANLSALSPPGEPIDAVTVNDPENAANASATVEFEVPTESVGGELSDLRVARQTDDGWSILETAVVSEANDTAVLSTNTTPGGTLAVTVVPAPTASIDAAEVVTVGESVELSAAGSTAENATLSAYEWEIGAESESGRTASTSFDSPGERTVALTVTDENGLSDDATETIVVNDRPEVSLDAPDSVTVGTAGSFSADVSDDVGDVTVTWRFDTGEVTGESVEHSFGSPGTQTVTVVVEDEYGATVTEEVEVVVESQDDDSAAETAPTTDATETTTDSEGGIPGFGLGVAVLALFAAAFLARTRR